MDVCKSADAILHKSMIKYFTRHKEHYLTMFGICTERNPLSLRALDWLCTNYSKSRSNALTDGSNIELYHKYKNNLKGFGKRHFDPFCRNKVIHLDLHGIPFRTTLGQLNFFRWAFQNNVVEYAIRLKQNIEQDMLVRINASKKKQNKRQQLSDLQFNHCQKRIKKVRVSFS